MTRTERKSKVTRTEPLPMTQQCQLLSISRSGLYYQEKGCSSYELELIRLLDKAHLDYPWYGSRSLKKHLKELGHFVNRKRVQRLMRIMGIRSNAPQKKTSARNKQHPVYPYLLRNLTIDRPNQVWAADITYIPMPRGHLYLMAIMDWYSRKVLSWRLSNTMDVSFCLDALEEAIALYGKPNIFNTDQGSQFTSYEFTGMLKDHEIQISMDGQGCWVDNVFVERLWRSLKYEEVYQHSYENVSQARESIGRYIKYYNQQRFHSSLDDKKPDQVYYDNLKAAA